MAAEVLAVCRYEFRMQARKWSLWVSAGVLGPAIVAAQGDRGPRYLAMDVPARTVIGSWALLLAIIMPVGSGMVLADRLIRDRRLQVSHLLDSLPVPPGGMLIGKYLGGVSATAMPGLAALLLAATGEFTQRRDPALFGWALLAFVLVTLPGLAMIGAYALVCPLVTTAPLFRVLFVGYWFWGNLLAPGFLPSLTGTLLAPIGDYAASWLLGERALYAGSAGWLPLLRPDPTGAAAALSVALIWLLAALPLAIAAPLLGRRRRTS